MGNRLSATTNSPIEWSLVSGKIRADPFNEVDLDVVVAAPDGTERRVPAFWCGGEVWGVRFAAETPGRYVARSVCTDTGDMALHGRKTVIDVTPYVGSHELTKRGPVRVNTSTRRFEHADGTPFFWLGDTQWLCLSTRLGWPDEFQTMMADRRRKGFSVVQIIAGLYPGFDHTDPRGHNEAGSPWEARYARINPSYFDMADLRIAWLVRAGLVPCLVGAWGFHIRLLGVQKMMKHWRYLIARYGCYPLVWCLAGETTMPWETERTEIERVQPELRRDWTLLARYVRATDPYRRPMSTHPSSLSTSRDEVDDPTLFDFEMLQAKTYGFRRITTLPALLDRAVRREPRAALVNAEMDYEGEHCGEELQRLLFWATILLGAAGHTYGANGVFQLNRRNDPMGPDRVGASWWSDTPWEVAYQYPGATQVGVGRRLIERYEWWRFQSHPEWVEPGIADGDYLNPYAAGIPGEVRVFYFPEIIAYWTPPIHVCDLDPGQRYRAFYCNPKDGTTHPTAQVMVGQDRRWRIPLPPVIQDWVLVVEVVI